MDRIQRWRRCCYLFAFFCGHSVPAGEPGPLTFEESIRPILRAHCLDCHGAEQQKEGNLDLRLVRFQQAGGDSGPALVPGNPDESYLVERIRSGEMPPGTAKVSPEELATIEQWIRLGAPTKNPEPESIPDGLGVHAEDRQWWSFQPIHPPAIQLPTSTDRLRHPIDALLAAQFPDQVSFSPDADRRTLALRIAFDLVGLPPTDDELERFQVDSSDDAVDRLVDRMLASPHYGERWGRHWLDVVGYADTEGGTPNDAPRPHAYRYRDYVTDAFNADKPFDRFIAEQLAGDEIAGPLSGDLTDRQIELLTATGFLRMAADGTGSGDPSPEARNQVVADTIKIVSTSLLGLSVACAQCHDHRYDPILQRDYYSLRAVFEPALDSADWLPPSSRLVSLYTADDRRRAADVEAEAQVIAQERTSRQDRYLAEAREKELSKFDEPLRERLRTALDKSADQRSADEKQLLDQNPSVLISAGVLYQYNQSAADDLKKLDQQIAEVRARKPTEEFIRALREPFHSAPVTHRFHRGDYRQPLEAVPPAMLTVVAPENGWIPLTGRAEKFATSKRRLALAEWLTGPDNPLTARVLANRFWMHHFGAGLVSTAADFGRLGTTPTHPALLDWLADEFRTHGWSLKQFHRDVIHSTAYRQSSARNQASAGLDPENRLLARQNVSRLDAELLRDRVLAASGTLDSAMHGPAAPLQVDDSGQVVIDPAQRRRTIYTTQSRSQPVALLQAFDAPVMQTNCELRRPSTVPTQSLMLMNGSFILDQANKLAERAWHESADQPPLEPEFAFDAIRGNSKPTWQFGYGSAEPSSDPETSFLPLAHWTGTTWQGGEKLPSEQTGWAMLSAQGGHPGKNPGFAVVRRWTAPAAGTISIAGSLSHPSENGDGVRGRAILNGNQILGEWIVQHGDATTIVDSASVSAGDTVDFVTDCREHETSDSFGWTLTVTVNSDNDATSAYGSVEGFHGPVTAGPPITSGVIAWIWQTCYHRLPTKNEWVSAKEFLVGHMADLDAEPARIPDGRTAEQQALMLLAQVLMTSNEFLYVD